jgi:hydrophobic/amphiphilic exporter-1 (mainly G- bacteria), HAE1 family
MDFIRFCINNPTKVTVGVLLVILTGIMSLFSIPIQLTPDVDRPIITVETNWVGRSPEEVERSVIEEQEDKLKGVASLKKMTANATLGQGKLELEFYVGTDMTRALQEVSDKLREVPKYPDDVDQPVIIASTASIESPMTWLILDHPDPKVNVQEMFDEVDKQVKPIIERVPGVSQVNIFGGLKREVQVQIDPILLAQRGITFNELVTALQGENVNISAGEIASGRLDVRVRTLGQYDNVDDINETIIAYTAGGPVRIKDVGTAVLTFEKKRQFVRSMGRESLAINAIRQTGANVMETMGGIRERVNTINRDILPNIKPGLNLKVVYDETSYIQNSIDLVVKNLWEGGVFAIIILLIFLGSTGKGRGRYAVYALIPVLLAAVLVGMLYHHGPIHNTALIVILLGVCAGLALCRTAAIISIAIPISLIGTFTVMTLLGRNLNVVSLAGLAFAVGMVVDNAIVVLENIDRHLAMGKSPKRAAYEGTREVWLALIASTGTHIVVFVPVLAIQDIAGQLFRDIALAVCASIFLSLIVAVTVIPAACAHFMKPHGGAAPETDPEAPASTVADGQAHTPVIVKLKDLTWYRQPFAYVNTLLADAIYWCTNNSILGWISRIAVVAFIATWSLVLSYTMFPDISYLPNGNMNLAFGLMFAPPSYSMNQSDFIAHRVESGLHEHWEAKTPEEIAKLPEINDMMTGAKFKSPGVENYFFGAFGGNIFMGGISRDPENVQPLIPLLNGAMSSVPGAYGFAMQNSLFGRGGQSSNSVAIELTGTDLAQIRNTAGVVFMALMQKYGPYAIRPDPMNFNLQGPELQVRVNQVRASELGINNTSLGAGVQALVDGLIIGDYRYKGQSIDLKVIRSPERAIDVESLRSIPLVVTDKSGVKSVVPLESIATLAVGDSPQQINRIEQLRAVTLIVNVPANMPLEAATREIQDDIRKLRDSRMIPPEVQVAMAGNADDLARIRKELLGHWQGWRDPASYKNLLMGKIFLALLVNFLLMSALFESWIYPLVIMFTVPLAAVGGFLGLAVVHHYVPSQQLDVVTMLGFIILIGTAVNNAILIVAQALNFMRGFGESESDVIEKMDPRMAIRESVRTRMRPVIMTTLTTVCGLIPLVVMPGAGSELYRGLGAVFLGGMILSSIFTLVLVPLMFSIFVEIKIAIYRALKWPVAELGEGEQIK